MERAASSDDELTRAGDSRSCARVSVACLASADYFVRGGIMRAESIGIASTILHIASICRRRGRGGE